MNKSKEKQDKHFPLFGHAIARLFEPPRKFFDHYVTKNQVVADLGCSPGFYTFSLAKLLGSEGKIYAVDSDARCIRLLQKKAVKRGYHNIEAHASSASDLSFIKDKSVDFILANGLLCFMAPQYHESAVNEMKRILKPSGLAYLSVANGKMSYMGIEEWEKILEEFKVKHRENEKSSRWAEVATKQR